MELSHQEMANKLIRLYLCVNRGTYRLSEQAFKTIAGKKTLEDAYFNGVDTELRRHKLMLLDLDKRSEHGQIGVISIPTVFNESNELRGNLLQYVTCEQSFALTEEEAKRLACLLPKRKKRPVDESIDYGEDCEVKGDEVEGRQESGIGPSTKPSMGRRLLLPTGITVQDRMHGRPTAGNRVGSGTGLVDVGLQFTGGKNDNTVTLPAGLLIVSMDGNIQNGLLVQRVVIVVQAGELSEWILQSYCANNTRDQAEPESEFTFGPILSTTPLQELFRLLKGKIIPSEATETVQSAVWEITDGNGLTEETRSEIEAI
jgi:hypothetical protein